MKQLVVTCFAALLTLGSARAHADEADVCAVLEVLSPNAIAERSDASRARDQQDGLLRFVEQYAGWNSTPSYVIERQDGDTGSVVQQAGPWRRTDTEGRDEHRTEYFNLETGLSIVFRRAALFQHEQMDVARPRSGERYQRLRANDADRLEAHLGEPCTVAQFDTLSFVDEQTRVVRRTELCLTPDGIELWRRSAVNGISEVNTAAVSIRRGGIDPASVRPPAEILTWAYWRNGARERQANAGPPDASADYEACYEGPAGRLVERRTDGHRYTHSAPTASGQTQTTITLPGLVYQLVTDDGGEPWSVRLSMSDRTSSDTYDLEPAGRMRRLMINGERCAWQMSSEMIPEAPMRHYFCMTGDGVPLQIRTDNGRLRQTQALTYLRRGEPSDDRFAPPVGAFAWID